jgi:hypothetical protein
VLQSQASWTKADSPSVGIDYKRRFRWPTAADHALDASIGRDELLSFDERVDRGDFATTVK